MSYYIPGMLETQDAINDHVEDPEHVRKLLHVEALMKELLPKIQQEVDKHGLRERKS